MTSSSVDVSWLKQGPRPRAVLQTKSRTASLTLARFTHNDDTVRHFESHPLDGYVAVLQVADLPAHDFCFDRKLRRQPAGSSHAFNIADLNAEPFCRISAPTDSLHLHIPRAALDDIASEADAPAIASLRVPEGWDTVDPIVQNIKETLVAATDPGRQTSQIFVDHMMMALHVHLARTYGGMRDASRPRRGGLASWQERRAKEMIQANLSKEQSIADIAAECRLSVAHFSRAFKESTGVAPHVWLQQCRVQRAKDLLAATGLSLAEVAVACGFADQSHFSRVFGRITGDTPGAWRRCRPQS